MNEDSAGDKWEKAETSSGILYYVNHKGRKTQWEHPKFMAALNSINECNSIKYAAYRTAAKICVVQKILGLDKVRLGVISGVFQRHRILVLENCLQLEYSELEAILSDIFFAASKEARLKPADYNVDHFTELTHNFLISVFDKNRDGSIQVIGVKVALVTLCCSRLQEKYQYLFNQLADHNNCLSKRKLKLLLEQFVNITDYLYESLSFSSSLIPDTIESCFEFESHGLLGVSEENFMSWVLKEPQLLVWVSTFYRLRAAENVTHSVRCAVCRVYPIKGLRYRCLHCISYDQCQMCFFYGKISKRHKLKHPMQEYSWQANHREATLSFLKALVNRLCGNTSRLQYLPAQPCDMSTSTNLESDSSSCTMTNNTSTGTIELFTDVQQFHQEKYAQLVTTSENGNDVDDDFDGGKYVTIEYVRASDRTDDCSLLLTDSTLQPQKELQSIINKLEDENRQLKLAIERLCGLDQGRVGHSLKEHRALVEAQVRRLKILKHHLQSIVPKAVQSTPLTVPNKNSLTVFKSPKLSPVRAHYDQSSDVVDGEYNSSNFISRNGDDSSLTELTFGCLSTEFSSRESTEAESCSGYSNWFSNAGIPCNVSEHTRNGTNKPNNNNNSCNKTSKEEQHQIDELQQGLDNILVKLQNMLASNFSLVENERGADKLG